MIICKYYRQGNCRNGQYCRFEHINNFEGSNKIENYNEDEELAVAIAQEVLTAERGGQWLLSCLGPLKDLPCIPGMEDVSPEEVRWQMYQAQKNGMVEQAKAHFQQLCQDMKGKRDALKNPTHETVAMLKKLLSSRKNNASGKSTDFSFASPQLSLPSTTSSNNVFSNKTFVSQSNPFNSSFSSTNSGTSLFGRTSNTSASIFGGTPTFGNSLGFNNQSNLNTVFGGTSNTSVFGNVQNTQAFSTVASQTNSIFGGGTSQSVFGQPSTFGATNQTTNVFAKPQMSQVTTSVFNNGTNTMFSTPQTERSLFGGTMPPGKDLFGGGSSTLQEPNSVFGTTTPTSLPNTPGNIFGSPETTTAFRGGSVFGSVSSIISNPKSSVFGGPATFGNLPISTNNIFGGSTVRPSSSTFGTASPGVTFENGASAVSTASNNTFGTTQSTDQIISASRMPFAPTSVTTTPFVNATSQIDPKNTSDVSFLNNTFSTTVTTPNSQFGTTTGTDFINTNSISSPFVTPTFGSLNTSSFTSTNTTVTTTIANPFTQNAQQMNSPFDNKSSSQTITSTLPPNGPFNKSSSQTITSTLPPNGPFNKSPFTSILKDSVIDDSIYSEEGQLTDDEKSMYLAEKFVLGKIPLKPPTKDIR